MTRILSWIGVVLVMGSLWFWVTWTSRCPGGPDGPYESYHDNGQLWNKGTYKDGERDGPMESYHDNGQLRFKGSYKDGERCGEWIEDGETDTYDIPCPLLRSLNDDR